MSSAVAATCATVTLLALTTVPAFASTYTVQAGDSLWTIAQSQGVSLSSLESANPTISPSDLLVGTSLQIPAPTPAPTPTVQSSPPPSATEYAQYLIQPGDTLWSVAHSYGISLLALEASNPSVAPNNLGIGTQLQIPATSIQAQNLYWLERVIHAEADGEPQSTQIAVGDVVMNRISNGNYGGDTVQSVVFDVIHGAYQFTSVQIGTIYNTPDAANVQAAMAVLQGENTVPSALVFYNPSQTPATSWVYSQPVVAQLGSLVFAS